MIGLFFFQKYLNKLKDFEFSTKWEMKIVPYSRRYFIGLLFDYIIAVGLITQVIMYGNDSIILMMLVFFFTAIIYGVFLIRELVKFIAINNTRFMQIKMGGPTAEFNKDNVVG